MTAGILCNFTKIRGRHLGLGCHCLGIFITFLAQKLQLYVQNNVANLSASLRLQNEEVLKVNAKLLKQSCYLMVKVPNQAIAIQLTKSR